MDHAASIARKADLTTVARSPKASQLMNREEGLHTTRGLKRINLDRLQRLLRTAHGKSASSRLGAAMILMTHRPDEPHTPLLWLFHPSRYVRGPFFAAARVSAYCLMPQPDGMTTRNTTLITPPQVATPQLPLLSRGDTFRSLGNVVFKAL